MIKHSIYIKNFIEDLYALASKEFQEVAWFENNQGLSSSYNSSANDLFDDHNLDKILYEEETILISRKVHQALKELDTAMDIVGYDKQDSEIINDPKMQIVREKASTVLELIKSSDGSESTVDFIKVGTSDTPISIEEAFK